MIEDQLATESIKVIKISLNTTTEAHFANEQADFSIQLHNFNKRILNKNLMEIEN